MQQAAQAGRQSIGVGAGAFGDRVVVRVGQLRLIAPILTPTPAHPAMNSDFEIRRLLEVLPASGRMNAKLISKPEQAKVIDYPFPLPWSQQRPVWINFDLWNRLPRPEQDLLILRTVSWLGAVRWFQPRLYQAIAVAGFLGAGLEAWQADPVGIGTAVGLGAIALTQIWRNNHSTKNELEADEMAIRVAQRRGYSETDAARHLLSAIETVAQIEGRSGLDFTELLRSQNLRTLAGLSPVGIPEDLRR